MRAASPRCRSKRRNVTNSASASIATTEATPVRSAWQSARLAGLPLDLRPGEISEGGNHGHVGIALEWHDQARQRLDRQPLPFGKFRLGGVDGDVRIVPQESHGHPLLPLAAKASP